MDFIKVDDMTSPHHGDEIAALRGAIRKLDRPMGLSLSPGPADINKASELACNAQMWRISGDFWDHWPQVKAQFDLFSNSAPYAKPDSWPDGDMIAIGRIGIRAERGDERMTNFTRDERHTLMTLWCIGRSPLILGAHLPANDAITTSLITNDEVIAVNQKAGNSRQLFLRGEQAAWTSEALGSNSKYQGVFNTGDKRAQDVGVNWADIGMPDVCEVRDPWARKSMGTMRKGNAFHVPRMVRDCSRSRRATETWLWANHEKYILSNCIRGTDVRRRHRPNTGEPSGGSAQGHGRRLGESGHGVAVSPLRQ